MPTRARGANVQVMDSTTAEPEPPPRAIWHRVLFVLWLAWLLALLYMSREEWTRPRPEPARRAQADSGDRG